MPYVKAMWRYSRGIAFAAQRNFDAARAEADAISALERTTDVDGTVVDANAKDLEHTVRREQIRHVIPHLPIDVVAIGVLQIARLVFGIERLDALLQVRN